MRYTVQVIIAREDMTVRCVRRNRGRWLLKRQRLDQATVAYQLSSKLGCTLRVQTSANAVRYPKAKAYPPKSIINFHRQLFQFVFNA